MVSFSLSCMLWESISLYSIPWGLSCAVSWCLCHWRNTANPSLACVSPRVLSVQVRRAGHQWLKPSNGPQHGGCCFSSSSLAAEDAGQADDLFQQCHILSYFSLCSQNSGRQGRQRRSGLLCWLIWKRPEFSHRTGRQPVPMHFPSLSPGWCGQNLAAWTTLTQPCFFALSNIFYPLVVSFLWCHFFFWIIQIYFIHTQGNFFFIKIFWHDFVCNFTR